MRKMAFSDEALIACIAIFPEKSLAQVQAKFSYDAIANCEKPNIRNYPFTEREPAGFPPIEMHRLIYAAA